MPDTVDLQLRQFVMSMLAKDPRDRPKDALVVSRTLSRIDRRLMDQETKLSDDTTIVPSHGRLPRRVSSTPHVGQRPRQVCRTGSSRNKYSLAGLRSRGQ